MSPLCELTPCEMFWMAEARARNEWNHTAAILAMMHNLVSKRAKSPADFHPMEAKGKTNGGGMLGAAMKLGGADNHGS